MRRRDLAGALSSFSQAASEVRPGWTGVTTNRAIVALNDLHRVEVRDQAREKGRDPLWVPSPYRQVMVPAAVSLSFLCARTGFVWVLYRVFRCALTSNSSMPSTLLCRECARMYLLSAEGNLLEVSGAL